MCFHFFTQWFHTQCVKKIQKRPHCQQPTACTGARTRTLRIEHMQTNTEQMASPSDTSQAKPLQSCCRAQQQKNIWPVTTLNPAGLRHLLGTPRPRSAPFVYIPYHPMEAGNLGKSKHSTTGELKWLKIRKNRNMTLCGYFVLRMMEKLCSTITT